MAKKKNIRKELENELWSFDGQRPSELFVLYTEDKSLMKRISRLKGCEVKGEYMDSIGIFAWNILIPRKQYNKVAEIAGLSTRIKA